ncbi:hypothetical protein HN51_004635 [Arachis hypogaea]|uniref:Uncharacterized protein LOC107483852 n=1 Tax=Arachis duranensis TaxID=130453 RepID=A0A6P4D0G6_ARADU|nr:uncharacterized protein LOC107483852 [Arachis duranensis]XP_025692144.1 uncharacterized protein LOC112794265 [Arachis hypogaea]QHO38217.1 uncharacterized protein DS421_4g118480 [Arachis hypogaea]
MAKHFSQYAILVLLLLTTSSSLMIMVASSEVCNKDGGGVGNNCSSLQQERCREKLRKGGGGCDEQWCTNACALKHLGQSAEGKCFGYYRNPSAGFCSCTFNC